MEHYDNLVDALKSLKAQGYTEDFNIMQDALTCSIENLRIVHNEFEVDKYFRFDEDTDPTQESALYAISVPMHNLKGVLVNGYGTYTDDVTDEILQKLTMKNS